MAEVARLTLLTSWVWECGKGFPYPNPEHYARLEEPFDLESRLVRAGKDETLRAQAFEAQRQFRRQNPPFVLRVADNGALVIQLEKGRNRPVVELARHIGRRDEPKSVVLLNGDGFENRTMQIVQADLRRQIETAFVNRAQRLLVPHAALTSARLDLDTIVPIHISRDRNTTQTVIVPKPPDGILAENTPTTETTRKEFAWEGIRYQVIAIWDYDNRMNRALSGARWQIMHRPDFAAFENWHQITEANGAWTVQERIHVLGQSVFSAVGPDGKRHRWLSGFDQQENPAMYFLAQIPDQGPIRYITHAVRLLAPPIIHRARKEGRGVFRQGDIFFVETDLTDEDFASHTVARRNELFIANTLLPETRANRLLPEARANRVLRRSLMIYATGHTADEVVTTDHGTYVRGTIYHDPILENIRANRPPEHQPRFLRPTNKWFLAVRNTVPRQTTTQGDSNGPARPVRHVRPVQR